MNNEDPDILVEVKQLPLEDFLYYYRGELIEDAPALNLANITQVGIQMYGGVYEEYSQSGVSSLEIDFIKAITIQWRKTINIFLRS